MSETKEIKKEVKQEGDFKIKKKKPRKLAKKDEITKVDLSKNKEETEDGISKSGSGNVDETQLTTPVAEVVEEVREVPQETVETKTDQVIEDITDIVENKETKESADVTIVEPTSNIELPENVEKLISFMNETGGDLEDYIRLNADYTDVKDSALLREYYKQIKPHLNTEEINFMMEDQFHYDEELDDERVVRKKKLAIKEEVVKAKGFLEDLKGKYYDEIKLRPGVTQEQQKAMDFFNRYNKEQDAIKQRHETFKATTKNFFTKEFEGFDISVGEKKFRYKINNPSEVADTQSDITNVVGKFLDENGGVKDYRGYHKAMYAARNVDTIAQHFYDQGRADAIKDEYAASKNISGKVRQTPDDGIYLNGLRVKAISGIDSSKLKVRTKNK